MTDTRAALETALAADPDDVALHAAYADLLAEQGDPRGEYIRLLLTLEGSEDPDNPPPDLMDAAEALRRRHEREWLGPLAAFVSRDESGESGPGTVEVQWWRGWVTSLTCHALGGAVCRAVTGAPLCRLLQRFEVTALGVMEWCGRDDLRAVFEFLRGTDVRELVVMWYEFGDDGVAELAASGLVARLERLALPMCGITDAGGEALARCPGISRLGSLVLGSNLFTPVGVAALAAAGVPLTERQLFDADDVVPG